MFSNDSTNESAPQVKRCSKCGESKSVGEYYFNKAYNSLYSHCKACHLVYTRNRSRRYARNAPTPTDTAPDTRGADTRFAISKKQEQRVIDLYASGTNMTAISTTMGCGRKAIAGCLKRNGIPIRLGGPNASGRYFDDDGDVRVRELYDSGMSLSGVSGELGLAGFHSVLNSLNRTGGTRPNRTYFFREDAFDKINDEETAYWAGFLYADGYINPKGVTLVLASRDADHVERFALWMNAQTEQVWTRKGATGISLSSSILGEVLGAKGYIVRRGDFDALIPHIPDFLHQHFVRGYMDGDGCPSVNAQFVFLGQPDILLWIQRILVEHADASPRVRVRQRRGICEISWGGKNQFVKIGEYIYGNANIFLQRKKDVYEKTRERIVDPLPRTEPDWC